MSLTQRRIAASAAVLAALAAGALAAPANAAPALVFPAGVGCAFPLGIDITPTENRVFKEFTDSAGNVVRTISAGKGNTLTFTNVSTGAVVTLKANGSVSKETFNPDGTSTVAVTGHNVIILFPTDVPAGPTTTLHTGQVVYTSTATDDFTILSTSGRTRDICAELS